MVFDRIMGNLAIRQNSNYKPKFNSMIQILKFFIKESGDGRFTMDNVGNVCEIIDTIDNRYVVRKSVNDKCVTGIVDRCTKMSPYLVNTEGLAYKIPAALIHRIMTRDIQPWDSFIYDNELNTLSEFHVKTSIIIYMRDQMFNLKKLQMALNEKDVVTGINRFIKTNVIYEGVLSSC